MLVLCCAEYQDRNLGRGSQEPLESFDPLAVDQKEVHGRGRAAGLFSMHLSRALRPDMAPVHLPAPTESSRCQGPRECGSILSDGTTVDRRHSKGPVAYEVRSRRIRATLRAGARQSRLTR